MDVLRISPSLAIPLAEIDVSYARSGGPGGQHVNKTETKVLLRFPVATSPSLSDVERARLLEKLAPRLTRGGELLITAEDHRERAKNLSIAYERLAEVLRRGLARPKKRTATKPSRGAKERRLAEKRRTGEQKRARKSTDD
jgi:ribosome-associated protein